MLRLAFAGLFVWLCAVPAVAQERTAQEAAVQETGWQETTGTPPAVLQGHVTASDGTPVAGVNVVARPVDASGATPTPRRAGTSTDSTGRYRLRLVPGRYRVAFTRVGFAAAEERVRVQGAETRLDVQLAPSTYTLNEIVVQESPSTGGPSRTSTIQRVPPQAVQVQDATSVASLGALIPAAHVQTNSRGQTLLYVRGAGDRQIGQFFDGALLNVPWDNRVDVGLLPTSVVEDVTVAKGVPPVRYGANVLGAAVNVQSRTLDRPGRRTEVRVQGGTARHRHAAVTHLGRTDAWTYTAAVEVTNTGDQPLPEDAAVPFSQPTADRRVNTDQQRLSGFARGTRQFDSGAEVSLTALHVDAEQGIAPESHVDPSVSRVRYWRYPLWQKTMLIGGAQLPVGDGASLRASAWGNWFGQDIDQYRSVDYEALQERQSDRDRTAGARVVGTTPLPAGQLTLSLNALTTRHRQANVLYDSSGAGPDSTTSFRQHLYSVGAEYDVDLTRRVSANVGASLDGTATPETGPFPSPGPLRSPSVTAGLRVDLGRGAAVRASGGRKGRFPTMRERFGVALGKFVPNPGLKPVSAWMTDGGVEPQRENVQGSVIAFYNRVRGAIDQRTIQTGPDAGKEQRVNLDGSRVWGVEASGTWTPSRAWTLRGHGTWMRPRSVRSGDETMRTARLDEKPALLGTGTATYETSFGLRLTGQASATGGTYARTNANTFTRLPDALVLDARAALSLDVFAPDASSSFGGEVFLRVDNLTDEARYLQLGLPGPGRQVRAGVTLRL